MRPRFWSMLCLVFRRRRTTTTTSSSRWNLCASSGCSCCKTSFTPTGWSTQSSRQSPKKRFDGGPAMHRGSVRAPRPCGRGSNRGSGIFFWCCLVNLQQEQCRKNFISWSNPSSTCESSTAKNKIEKEKVWFLRMEPRKSYRWKAIRQRWRVYFKSRKPHQLYPTSDEIKT